MFLRNVCFRADVRRSSSTVTIGYRVWRDHTAAFHLAFHTRNVIYLP
jgi:hypothetical protein